MDFSKYYDVNDEQNIETQIPETPIQEEPIENTNTCSLTEADLNQFINRFSGIDPNTGYSKTTISYQTYDFDAPDDDPNKQRVYQLTNAVVQISRNKRYNDLYTIDFIFKSPDDTELKLFWARLQQYLKNQSQHSDKDWIFYINLLERASVSLQTLKNDTLLIGNIINPILFYITREVPNLAVFDKNINQEMIGGNIIRMVVGKENLTFNLETDIDTNLIKGEVQREEEDSRFIDNQFQNTSNY